MRPSRTAEGLTLLVAKGEGTARLEDRKDADQTLVDAISIGHLTSGLLHRDLPLQVLVGPPSFLGHVLGVRLQGVAVLRQERLQMIAGLLGVEEACHLPTVLHGEIAAEDEAVEARERALNLLLVLLEEVFHAGRVGQHRSPMHSGRWAPHLVAASCRDRKLELRNAPAAPQQAMPLRRVAGCGGCRSGRPALIQLDSPR